MGIAALNPSYLRPTCCPNAYVGHANWLAARQSQATDRTGAYAAEVRAVQGQGLRQGAHTDPVPMQRRGDEDREDADSSDQFGSDMYLATFRSGCCRLDWV